MFVKSLFLHFVLRQLAIRVFGQKALVVSLVIMRTPCCTRGIRIIQ